MTQLAFPKDGVRWIGLPFFQVDCAIVPLSSGRIEPSGPALKVLFVFYKRARLVFKQKPEAGAATELPIRLFVSQKVLSKQTGLSKRAIVKAVKELETARFIEAASGGQHVRGKGRRANHYYLLHDGEALLKVGFYNKRGTWVQFYNKKDKTLLGSNGIRYFTCPDYVVTDILPYLDSTETRVYCAVLWLANEQRSLVIDISHCNVQAISGVKTARTFAKALSALIALGLIIVAEHRLVVCDPETRSTMNTLATSAEDNHRNWRMEDGKRSNPVERLRAEPELFLTRLLGDDAAVSSGARSEHKFRCPLHDDHTPSASINTETGLWRCFVEH